MKLIIGGYAQGKLNYVLQKFDAKKIRVFDGELREVLEDPDDTVVINHLHQWIRSRIEAHGHPEEELLSFVEHHPNCIIICDEVGNGLIPMDASERGYRERTGRMMVELAKRAEEVERVICGMGQKIK